MPKAKHGTLNKLKDAIIGGKEEEPKNIPTPPNGPLVAKSIIPETKQKRKYTKTSTRWTTQKDVNDAVLKDIASNCCKNNNNNQDINLLDIPVQTQTVQAPKEETKSGKKKQLAAVIPSPATSAVTSSSDKSTKFHKINAWKSPWEKLYVMMTLRDLDRMRLAFIQKKLKTINSAEVLRDALKLYYETMRKQEKEKKLSLKNK